jgi:hypothetical protein
MEGEDPTPERLSEQERLSREAAADAGTEEEVRANLRRADKARYLQEKLRQQRRADEEADR